MTRATRLGRGALAAAVSLFLAAFSHGVAGGDAPGLVGLALSSIVALAASVAFIGKRATLGRTALAVGIGQAVFHLLFSVGAASSAVARLSGTGHHADLVFSPVAGGTTHPHSHTEPAMLAGHVVAGIATIVYLLTFEAALWRAVRAGAGVLTSGASWVVRALVAAIRGAARPVAPARFRLAVVDLGVASLSSRLLGAVQRHRGPPVIAVSA